MFQQAESTALTGIHIPIHSNVGYGVLPIAEARTDGSSRLFGRHARVCTSTILDH